MISLLIVLLMAFETTFMDAQAKKRTPIGVREVDVINRQVSYENKLERI